MRQASDVRVIAATNRPLHRQVEQGSFREDLYYRLNVITVDLPPLRERLEDIPLLVKRFARRQLGRLPDQSVDDVVPPDALAALAGHPWPGNVRELFNHVQRMMALADPHLQPGPPGPSARAEAAGLPGPDHPEVADFGEIGRLTWPYVRDRVVDLADEVLHRSAHTVARATFVVGVYRQIKTHEALAILLLDTEHVIEDVPVVDGNFVSDAASGHLKIAVIERHRATGNIGLGIVKGLGLQDGAIATTVAHDSHNVIVVGTNDEDMLIAINALHELQGGLVVVQNGQILATLPLRIAGLMSSEPFPDVYDQLKAIDESLLQIGAPTHFNAFLTLSFLSLPVIPHLKLTDRGLFDVASFRHIEVVVREG